MFAPSQQNRMDRIALWEVDMPPVAARADSVQEAFELLAPSAAGPLVARLVPLPADAASLPVIDLHRDAGCVTLGRSKELVVECRVNVGMVSGRHCELHVSPTTQHVTVRDISTNGTYVNGKRIEKGVDVRLESGDCVSLTKPGNSEEKRCSGAEYIFQRVSNATVADVLQSSLGETLKVNSNLKSGGEEEVECLDFDGGKLRKRSRDEDGLGSDHDLYDDDDDDETGEGIGLDISCIAALVPTFERKAYGHTLPRGSCRHCENASPVDGFRCPTGALHLCCLQCGRLFPNRPLCSQPQSCQLCGASYCDLYYKEEGGCPGGCSSGGLARLDQRPAASALPRRTFGGSAVEQKILSRHLAAKGIRVQDVWAECLERLRAREWVPDVNCVSGQVASDSPLCGRCADVVFAALLFHYRRAVPRDELPESVTDRPNCWYGVNCRAQFHDMGHAKKYNHVCCESKRKE